MTRYFGIDEANARLADLRPLLEELRADRDRVAEIQQQLERGRATNGSAEHAEELTRLEVDIREVVHRMQRAVNQIDEWGVTLRDISSGLIDFPALATGRPIWLCWRLGEGNVEWWHETSTGFGGRQPLADLT